MKVLSFETATYFGGVGFLAPGVRDCLGPFASRQSSAEVMAAADELIRRHGCSLEDLDVIAVSTGPGLFTGVRVGMAIAKTLAFAQRMPSATTLVGVPTLRAVASLVVAGESSVQPGDLVAAITDARRGEVYAGIFEVVPEAGSVKQYGEDVVVRPERIAEELLRRQMPEGPQPGARLWLIGDGVARYEDSVLTTFTAALPSDGELRAFPLDGTNLPLQVADLGVLSREPLGQHNSCFELGPHYVRRPDARPSAVRPFLSSMASEDEEPGSETK